MPWEDRVSTNLILKITWFQQDFIIEVVEDKVLQLIADEVRGREWRRLARCLKLSERHIEEIDHKRGQGDLRGCCRDMMALWKGQCGPDAVGFILAKALHKADLRQLAEQYIEV